MINLKVVNSDKHEKEPVNQKYLRALNRFREKNPNVDWNNRDLVKKFFFLSVKYLSTAQISTLPKEIDVAQNIFYAFSKTTDLLALLTPKEFMNVFPIKKSYDGKKYEMKDYFSTIEEVKNYPMDEPIGKDKIMHFLMDYYNEDIINFEVNEMCAMSSLRKSMGEKGIMEEFCENNGIPTYTSYNDLGIMVENGTGKVMKVSEPKKRIPKSLRVVK